MTALLKNFLNLIVPQENSWQNTLRTQWTTVMGTLSEQVCLEKIQGTALVLGVYDAHWMQELYLLSPMLIKTINDQLGANQVQTVRFRAASRRKIVQKQIIASPQPKQLPIALTSRQQVALAKIEDPELRLMVKEFWFRCCRTL